MRSTIIALSAVFVLGMAAAGTAAAETSGDDLTLAQCTLDNPPSHCEVGPVHCSFSDGYTNPDCYVEPIVICTLDWPPSYCKAGPVTCGFGDGFTDPYCSLDA